MSEVSLRGQVYPARKRRSKDHGVDHRLAVVGEGQDDHR